MKTDRNGRRGAALGAVVLVAATLAPGALAAPSADDYQRAQALNKRYEALVDRQPSQPLWLDAGHFLYRRTLARSGAAPAIEYRRVAVADGRNEPAFDHARLAAAMSAASGKPVDASALQLQAVQLDAHQLAFESARVRWQCALPKYNCTRTEMGALPPDSYDLSIPLRQGPAYAQASPDGKWRAWVEAGNLVVAPAGGGNPVALSRDGSAAAYYAVDSIAWSPDSTRLVAYRIKPAPLRTVHYIESAPPDQLQPKLHQQIYAKPGDPLPVLQPVLFDLASRQATAVPATLFPNAFVLSWPQWRRDGSGFTFEYNERGHQRYRVIEADGRSAQARTLIEETSPTFIEYSDLSGTHEDGGKRYRHDFADGAHTLWASERDGWEQLYLYDTRSGGAPRQVTRGEWVVRKVERVDEAKQQLYFMASGMNPGEDPYYRHAYRIGLDGRGLTALTPAQADHEVVLSPDGRWLLDLYSRVDLGPVLELRRADDGALVQQVERTDLTRLRAAGWVPPLPFHAPGRDGKTEIWGVIHRPQAQVDGQRYRVVENIYAGPHGSFVPKTFSARVPALTALGFAVAQIDGMGTNNRSRAFHDVAWRNLKDAGFPDRIAWHRAVAAQYPWYAIAQGVGIYGTSAGGQSALGALLFHPEFYVAAVANSGCHDNRMDKIWWNEQWMGWPVGPWYSASSNVDNAWRLQGHLLLVTGDMDHNVDPASTFQVADRLIKAGKDFDLLVVPGGDHGAGGDYGQRRLADFFVRWLQQAPTPDWNRQTAASAPVAH
ncbi:peptidase [Xanthomonas translucens pv. poae]|uniref:Peptidase n=1 Tax=Xanthomonas graminis pv. poae TaxID=227946 RepID=A0A0K2ZJ47_9XANT|nr:S9 family peptidase [Xanthomonas translucens]UKE63592.1 S9 family peptidase [Xanthomonas translucens pv. poae]CTP83400.1 peptidase [Xanthomonas translucens pv. poae]